MRVVSLASGSSGNALLVEAGPLGRSKLLVDAGLGPRLLRERLQRIGVEPAELQGILLTHEHSDHVQGLPSLLKHYSIPLITDPRTFGAVQEGLISGTWRTDFGAQVSRKLKERVALSSVTFVPLVVGTTCLVGDIEVRSFPLSHDAVAPCGYLLRAGGCRVCVVSDSGEVTAVMREHMRYADLLVLEANHDRERLLQGPYPHSLKQRILSSTGHLSNDQAADAVLQTWPADGLRWLWLSHLSRTNNTPALALTSMRLRLKAADANLAQLHISVLPPDMSTIWDSTQLWHTSSLWSMDV